MIYLRDKDGNMKYGAAPVGAVLASITMQQISVTLADSSLTDQQKLELVTGYTDKHNNTLTDEFLNQTLFYDNPRLKERNEAYRKLESYARFMYFEGYWMSAKDIQDWLGERGYDINIVESMPKWKTWLGCLLPAGFRRR